MTRPRFAPPVVLEPGERRGLVDRIARQTVMRRETVRAVVDLLLASGWEARQAERAILLVARGALFRLDGLISLAAEAGSVDGVLDALERGARARPQQPPPRLGLSECSGGPT